MAAVPNPAPEARRACIDGNEAVARVAHRLSEVIAIYPITPASPMGELADTWSAEGRPNLWGEVPEIVEMQSEAGAAGALHGAVLGGALATTFTASQGLLLMIPNLFKIAGELGPCVVHVASRAVATHALSIFGDHSDVMAARSTGFALLASGSVQEAHDLAAVSHATALRSRVPFLHFMDGFRTSHEVNRIELLDDDDLRALVDEQAIAAHRARRLDPERPTLRGTSQNPDVFFQCREAVNPFYELVPEHLDTAFEILARRTGRRYGPVAYRGHPEAERVLVLMGSAAGAAAEAVDALTARGERVGLLQVRLFRPFPGDALLEALPPSARAVAVLDRTKEPGAPGEPLYLDVAATLLQAHGEGRIAGGPPRLVGGRYGLGSKEFTPAMAKAVLDALVDPAPRSGFTVGIRDDVTHRSLPVDEGFRTEGEGVRALFYGLGSDGTVGAAKSTVKIIGERTPLHAQGYFVYDSKKSGAVTVSHLRFAAEPIRSTYLIDRADFISCHHESLLWRIDVLAAAVPGATLLLNHPRPPDRVFDSLPREVQERILELGLRVFAVDADRVAREVGLGGHVNTVMQPCFFALAGVLPREQALDAIRDAIRGSYGRRGPVVVQRNLAAVDRALSALHPIPVPEAPTNERRRRPPVPEDAPEFVRRVTGELLAGRGDRLPVSDLPVDGTWPTGTARFEKRGIAAELPVWDPELCIDCGKCAMVCPHAAIRMKVCEPEALEGAPEGFRSRPFRSRELPGMRLTIQVAPDDCTGCGVCADVCPARSKEEVRRKSLMMIPAERVREAERPRFEFFLSLPEIDRTRVHRSLVKGVQCLEPRFEFSGACAGCGETPYLKLLTQLFGDRLLVANATGCSSIYGGNLPTTPWSPGRDGRGPAWANSLFEDNAEFGLGLLLAQERHARAARELLRALRDRLPGDRVDRALAETGRDETAIARQRHRIEALRPEIEDLARKGDPRAAGLLPLLADLLPRSIWLVGGDGWAYDIGSAGLDHVLASGRNVNVLVLDTQVYSNTGGQASKATPRGAVAKFASAGKSLPRKDLGLLAMAYGNVYVAQIALGADDQHTLRCMIEAEAWDGPSLLIAYSTCIAHGIDMSRSMSHQRDAVRSGFWPLYHYHPGRDPHARPFRLDSRRPSLPLAEFALREARFAMLARSDPERARQLLRLARRDAEERWRFYEQLAGIERAVPSDETGPAEPARESSP